MAFFNKLFIAFKQDTKIRNMSTKEQMTPLELLFERIFSVITILGLTCLCSGLLLHIAGRALNDLFVARIGAYMLLIGILLVAMRVSYWIIEKIVEQGLNSMPS